MGQTNPRTPGYPHAAGPFCSWQPGAGRANTNKMAGIRSMATTRKIEVCKIHTDTLILWLPPKPLTSTSCLGGTQYIHSTFMRKYVC